MDERKRKSGTGPGGKLKGDHLWNSCGSEAEKDERKPSAKPSTRNRKDGTGNQAGSKGKDPGSESGREAPEKPAVRRRREESGKEEQIG